MRNGKTIGTNVRLILVLLVIASPQTWAADKKPKAISTVNYHGWADSFVLSNGTVEAVVVPAVGRVMQFHFVGEGDVLWENTDLQGKPADITLRYARRIKAELIVLASNGRRKNIEPRRIVDHAPCAVLVAGSGNTAKLAAAV